MIESELRTDSSQYNAGTREKQQIHEERNTAENWKPIMDAFASGRGRDLNDEPKRTDHMPAFVISSGPSLDDVIERLREWKGGIFCSTSHATTLMHYGVEPTHMVVLDPFCSWDEISGVDWSKSRTKMIVNPSVWPDLIRQWPNEVLFFIQNIGRRDSYYATTQQHMFCRREPDTPKVRTPAFHPMIRTEMTLFACTPPAQMFAADILGYGRVFLAGCDYAYSPLKTRFTRWQADANGTWKEDASPFDPAAPGLIITDNGLASEQMHLYYKKNHLSAWRLSLQDCYSVDRYTALTEAPRVGIDRVIRDQGEGLEPLPKAEIIRRTEHYLARVGAFVVKSNGGVSYLETPNPLEDLPRYMATVRRAWKCPKCGTQATSKDDVDHSGEVCQACHNVGMQRLADIDIEANMERIARLVKEAARVNAKHVARHAGKMGAAESAKPALARVETVIGTDLPVNATSAEMASKAGEA